MSHFQGFGRLAHFRFLFVALLLMLACSRAALADTWSTGQVITYGQDDWDNPIGPAGLLLSNDFANVYFSNSGIVQIGIPGATGYSITFDSSVAVQNYLPAFGPAGALTANLFDPTDSPSGGFGGDVLALQLDVDFADAGLLDGTAGLNFGDLQLDGISTAPAGVPCVADGTSVREVLAMANTDLGGGSSPCAIGDLDPLVEVLSYAFEGGTPQPVAQYLVAPTSVTPTPEPSSVLLLGVGLLGLGVVQYKRRAGVSSMAA